MRLKKKTYWVETSKAPMRLRRVRRERDRSLPHEEKLFCKRVLYSVPTQSMSVVSFENRIAPPSLNVLRPHVHSSHMRYSINVALKKLAIDVPDRRRPYNRYVCLLRLPNTASD